MPQSSRLFGTNFCTNSGVLTATGAETVYDTTVAINYCVEGKTFIKATVADGTTPIVDGDGQAFPALAVTNEDGSISGKGATILWCVDAAGLVVCFQGVIGELDLLSTDFLLRPDFPSVPDDLTPFAYQILKQQTDGTTADTATFGTSNWNATRFTNVIVDIMTVPRRPQSS